MENPEQEKKKRSSNKPLNQRVADCRSEQSEFEEKIEAFHKRQRGKAIDILEAAARDLTRERQWDTLKNLDAEIEAVKFGSGPINWDTIAGWAQVEAAPTVEETEVNNG